MTIPNVTVQVTTPRRTHGIIGPVRIIGIRTSDTLTERWKPVSGHNEYLVSSWGRVHSFKRDKAAGRLLHPGTNADGYSVVVLDGRTRYVHDLVLAAFVGPKPHGLQVRHLLGLTGGNGQARKTHCPQGHAYTVDNLCKSTTVRKCRTCHNDRSRAARRAA